MSVHYERLSFLDNSFLALESRNTHFHVAAMLIFEAGALTLPDGGIDVARIKSFIESRLHLVPRYRQHLAYVPLERYPVWVDDAHFNIDYHIRHSSLPRPGSFEQLEALMGRLSSQQLDRSKPLWELNVVEGLEGDNFAIITKIHHAMIDGISGVDLMAVMLNLAPTDDFEPGPPYEARDTPSGAEFLISEAARRAGRAAAALRSVQTLSADVRSLALQGARRVRAMRNSLSSGWLSQATKTPLNGTIGPNRRFGTLGTPLDEVKEVKNAFGGSVNDVILATVAGGVRHFLRDVRGFEMADIDFRAMAPVSVRSPSERGTLGNQVAMWLVSLPVGESDPVKRLEAVQEETRKLKETDQALGAASLVRMSAGTPATLVSLASRLATGARPFNLTVTNVPGPQFPLYLLGAKLIRQYPLVPLWHGHGVGIALFSYDGEVSWGFNADYDVLEDLDELVAAIQASFEELLTLARKPAKKRGRRTAQAKAAQAKGTQAERPRSETKSKDAPRTASSKTAKSATLAGSADTQGGSSARSDGSQTPAPKKRPPLGTGSGGAPPQSDGSPARGDVAAKKAAVAADKGKRATGRPRHDGRGSG